MKKLISLLLSLMMLALPLMGLAEEKATEEVTGEAAEAAADIAKGDDDYANFTDPNGMYGFYYDKEWTILSKDTIDTVLDAGAQNEQLKSVVENARAALESTNMVLLLSPSMNANITVTYQDAGVELTSDQLVSMLDIFKTQISKQMGDITVTFEDGTGELVDVTAGKALQFVYSYTLNNVNFGGLLYVLSSGTGMVSVTLTASESEFVDSCEDVGFVLGSLQLA